MLFVVSRLTFRKGFLMLEHWRFGCLIGCLVGVVVLAAGCVSRGPEVAKISVIGQPPPSVLAAIVDSRAIKLEPVETRGVIVGFNGLVTRFLEHYAGDLEARYATKLRLVMARDLPNVSDGFWLERQTRRETIVVMGFSNNRSFFGLGGRNAFLTKLARLGVPVNLLVLFDDVWEGEIPENVKGVINVHTGDLISGRAMTAKRLRGKETWVVNVHFRHLWHSRLPFLTGGASPYEEFTRRYYSGLILASLDQSR